MKSCRLIKAIRFFQHSFQSSFRSRKATHPSCVQEPGRAACHSRPLFSLPPLTPVGRFRVCSIMIAAESAWFTQSVVLLQPGVAPLPGTSGQSPTGSRFM